jgi:hypothetical protein
VAAHCGVHGQIDGFGRTAKAVMRRPDLLEVEFFLLAALTLPAMLLGIAQGIKAVLRLF